MQKFFYKCKCGSRGVIKADNKPEEGSIECFVCGRLIMDEDILEPEKKPEKDSKEEPSKSGYDPLAEIMSI